MTETIPPIVQQALLVIFGAIIGGAITGVSGIVKLYTDPVQDYRRLKGEIASALWQYGNVSYQSSNRDEARSELRRLSGELQRVSNSIPSYRLFSFLRLVPTWHDIQKASSNLIGLTTSLGATSGEAVTIAEHHKWEIVRTALGIR